MDKSVYLVLGCNGKTEVAFMSCSKCENKILELSEKLEQINDIVIYFKALNLFQKSNRDYNDYYQSN